VLVTVTPITAGTGVAGYAAAGSQEGNAVRKLTVSLAALCVAGPCLAAAETYQICLEIFDESRETTVCTYRSRAGQFKIIEHGGRYFCPRVLSADDRLAVA